MYKLGKKRVYLEWLVIIGCIGIWLTGFKMAIDIREEEKQMQQELAEEVIRFHVLANSDSTQDQKEKLEVRNAVVEMLEPILKDAENRGESRKRIMENMNRIENAASQIAGTHSVRVSLGTDWFPEIAYGEMTFPEGEYEALRIEIGEAKGHNWWCVLYPGLCFADVSRPVVTEEGKEKLNLVLEEDTYEWLLHPEKIKIRFRWF